MFMFAAIPDWKMCIATIKTQLGAARHELLKSSAGFQIPHTPSRHDGLVMVRKVVVLLLDMYSDVKRGTEKRSGPHFRLFVIAPLANWMLVKSMNSARP